MADSVFVLYTTCPDGHPVPMRRRLDIWRVSLEMPSIVLWCHECGLQWDALPHDRAAIVRALDGTHGGTRAPAAVQGNIVARAS